MNCQIEKNIKENFEIIRWMDMVFFYFEIKNMRENGKRKIAWISENYFG